MFWKRGKLTKKTNAYLNYQQEILYELREVAWIFEDNPIAITIEAGLSTKGFDLDNVLKPLLDTLQSIYKDFNDNKVYYIEAHKVIVPKGEEYLDLKLEEYDRNLFERRGNREIYQSPEIDST